MAVYATLASDPGTLAVSYLGVSDAWLLRCEQDLTSRPVGSFRRVCIPLEAAERDALAHLLGMSIDWVSVIGPSALSLLQSGVKLELEGASNPDLYSAAFVQGLRQVVFG
jgi:hypothetical protein